MSGEDHAKDGHAEQRNDFGPEAGHFASQSDDAGSIFMRSEDIDACSAAANDIRETQSPFREAPIVLIGELVGDQSRFIKELPESIGMAREVMTHLGGSQPRIDPDKQDCQIWANVIRECSVYAHVQGLQQRLRQISMPSTIPPQKTAGGSLQCLISMDA